MHQRLGINHRDGQSPPPVTARWVQDEKSGKGVECWADGARRVPLVVVETMEEMARRCRRPCGD